MKEGTCCLLFLLGFPLNSKKVIQEHTKYKEHMNPERTSIQDKTTLKPLMNLNFQRSTKNAIKTWSVKPHTKKYRVD